MSPARRRPNRRKPAPSLAQELVRRGAGDWSFGILHASLGEGGEVLFLAFVDCDAHLLFPPFLSEEGDVEAVREAWSRARESGLGPPPERVRVASEELRGLVEASCGGEVNVVIAETPEFVALQKFVSQEFVALESSGQGGVSPSYFHGRPIAPELIRHFFAAVASFRKAQPWRKIGAEDFLDLEIPGLQLTDACVSVNEDAGLGGLEIFTTQEALRESLGRLHSPLDMIGVMLFTQRQLPEELRQELGRLPFAPPRGAVPALTATDPAGVWRAIGPRDYLIAIAALRAVSQLAEALDAETFDFSARVERVEIGTQCFEVRLDLSRIGLGPWAYRVLRH